MSLLVTRAIGLCTIQDLGRRGHMHEAVPPGGALVPELLGSANRAARNPAGTAAIEVQGELVVRAIADIVVATARDTASLLRAGAELVVASGARRCAYLAVRGGVESPLVLGGRGTLLCAGLGTALRAGDAIAAGDAGEVVIAEKDVDGSTGTAREDDPIRVIAGPDLEAFVPGVLEALTSTSYRVLPTSDRVGTRLDGPRLLHVDPARGRSRPMVRGALEIPPDGNPIVLGPEHPTTGGYPVVAVIATVDLGRFFAIRLGGPVRFIEASREG